MGTPDGVLSHLTAASQALSAAFRCAWEAGDRSGAARISAAHVSIASEIEVQLGGDPRMAHNHRGFEIGGES